jgi:hypothetical protein
LPYTRNHGKRLDGEKEFTSSTQKRNQSLTLKILTALRQPIRQFLGDFDPKYCQLAIAEENFER